jgi:hypothetical protein
MSDAVRIFCDFIFALFMCSAFLILAALVLPEDVFLGNYWPKN